MRIEVKTLFLLLLFTFTLQVKSTEQTLHYGINALGNWVPYAMENEEGPGIMGEIVPLILEEAGLNYQGHALPPRRILRGLAEQSLDMDIISPSWFAQNQIPEGFVLSAPIIDIEEYYIFPNPPRSEVKEPAIGTAIGTVAGYFYHDQALFKRFDFLSERDMIVGLGKKRVDVAIAGAPTAHYWAEKLNIPILVGPKHSGGKLHLRLLAKHTPLLPQINQAITRLDEQGVFAEIRAKYIRRQQSQ